MNNPSCRKNYPKELIIIAVLALSLFFNLFGINWGLPSYYHPDEAETINKIVIPMAQNLDPNPHSFLKPSFYYYFLQFILSPYYIYYKLFNAELNIGFTNFTSNVFLISRITTALIGTFSVFLLYSITRTAFNLITGLLAAFFLAVSMSFSAHSHFAYMDIPAICLLLLMMYLSIQYIKTSRLSKLYLAAIIGGLSISTKYNTGLTVLLVIMICHVDKIATIKFFDATNKLKALFPKSLIIAFLLVFLVFFLTTPFALLDFPAFANDMLEQLFVAKTGYKGFSGNGWMGLNNLLHLNHAIGTPLLLLALCGFMWGLGIFFKKPNKITAIFLFAPIIYFLSISNWRISATRYTLLLLPFMAFWAAAHINLSQNFSKSFRLLFLTAVIFVGLYSSYYTFRGVHCFAMDTRDNSANWIRDNIPLGSQVEVYSYKFYLPNFPNGLNVQRIVLNMPPSLDYNKFKAKIRKNRFVLFILKLYGKSKINDGVAQIRLNNMSLFSIDSLSKRNPDFIVLTSFFYQRFLNRNRPNEANPYAELTYYFEQILSNHAGYEIVKVFDDKTPTGEFVNPKIIILKKVGSRSIN